MLALRLKAEESRLALAAQRSAAERSTCDLEMVLERRVEEIGAEVRGYEAAALALKIVPFGAKRANNVRRSMNRLAQSPLPLQLVMRLRLRVRALWKIHRFRLSVLPSRRQSIPGA